MEEILEERLGILPERDKPLNDGDDTYHNPETLEKITTRSSQVAMGFLIVAILLLLNLLVSIFVALFQDPAVPLVRLFTTFSSSVSSLVLILVCGFFYVALKAIEEGLFPRTVNSDCRS